MYCKIIKGNSLFEKFSEMQKRITKVKADNWKIVEGLEASEYAGLYNYAVGGISSVKFDTKPKGWKNCPNYSGFYTPLLSNKEMVTLLDSAPKISYGELRELIGFEQYRKETGGRITTYRSFGWEYVKKSNTYILDIPTGAKFEKSEHIIEILESEYLSLKAQNEPPKPKKKKEKSEDFINIPF